jgi:hypothetical protein
VSRVLVVAVNPTLLDGKFKGSVYINLVGKFKGSVYINLVHDD